MVDGPEGANRAALAEWARDGVDRMPYGKWEEIVDASGVSDLTWRKILRAQPVTRREVLQKISLFLTNGQSQTRAQEILAGKRAPTEREPPSDDPGAVLPWVAHVDDRLKALEHHAESTNQRLDEFRETLRSAIEAWSSPAEESPPASVSSKPTSDLSRRTPPPKQ